MSERTTGKKFIKIRGANVNNLKNLSVDIPRDEFVVQGSFWVRWRNRM